jgi:NADH-quinone oxidoreductase subunit L
VEALRQQFPQDNFALLAVVLLLPALGAFVNGVFGKRLGKEAVRLMALSALGGAFFASLLTFLLLPHGHEGHASKLYWLAWRWLSITGRLGQSIPIDVAFSVDGMTATMMLVVTGVGFLIHLYSSEYMKDDPGYYRFFAYLNLFIFSMLVLIMGDNLAVLFVGWEGVGLCSYLLIGFWFSEEKNASAGKKAFIVNRIGDFGLLVAICMLVYYTGSLSWDGIAANAGNLLQPVKIWPIGNLSHETLPAFLANVLVPSKPVLVYGSTLCGLMLFLGCAGKSAQIPLYVWLPDAMAGPTPVSALIHAATMVTAGVYLVARLSSVFLLSPAAMATVAVVGAATAVLAASIGLFQTDLKKVLAYSTVSQLGFMFIGVGVGAFTAGFFHVFTHAFFKACLFLGAGSVIHAMHARIHDTDRSQNMHNMGGLRKYMPTTHWTFLVSCLAIAGVPPLAGFWSKDEILWKAFSTGWKGPIPGSSSALPMWTWPSWLGPAIYWVGIFAATMTAFYMFRAYFLTFHGSFRGWKIVKGWKAKHGHDEHGDHGDHHADEHGELEGPTPHESPWAMTVPLMVLGGMAVAAGFLNAHPIHVAPLGHLLDPIFAKSNAILGTRPGTESLMWAMMAPGLVAAVVGIGLAYVVYFQRKGEPERRFAESAPGLYRLIVDKWRIDELYDATVVGMVDALADIFTMADKWIVDGILARLSAAVVGFVGAVLRAFQTGRVQVYSATMVVGLAFIGWFSVRPHAEASVDDLRGRVIGEFRFQAVPGLGYQYKWEVEGVAGAEFGNQTEHVVKLAPGQSKKVTLRVRGAFATEATKTFEVSRPALSGQKTAAGPAQPMQPGKPTAPPRPDDGSGAPPRPVEVRGEQIGDLIRGNQ